MAEIRNPFNPMRFTGRNGLLTVEEASRLQDLIKGAGDTFTRTVNQILQQFDVTITTVTTTPGPAGAQGIPGLDGEDGADGLPGRDGKAGAQGIPGVPGIDGLDGDDGPIGFPGRDGARGRDGAIGMDGIDGEDAIIIPGMRGAAGRDGSMLVIFETADDSADTAYPPPPSPITWPAAPEILVSSGPSTPPVGHPGLNYDSAVDGNLELSDDVALTQYNTGGGSTGNYERVRAKWISNIWTLKSEKGGTGTVRSMTIDADTATLTLRGNSVDVHGAAGAQIGYLAGVLSTPAVLVGGTTSVGIAAGTGTHPSQSFAQSQITIDTSIALAGGFPAGSTWNGLLVTGAASVPGTGTITAAFAATKFSNPTITGTGVGATVNEAATVLIAGGPIASALSINVKYALWVQGDVTRIDGQAWLPTVANGSVATALTSVGPVGSHTTVQKWFVLYDTGGTPYYVPGF